MESTARSSWRSPGCLFLAAAAVLLAALPAAGAPPWPGQAELDKYLAKYRGTRVGLCAVEVTTGSVLVSYNAETPMLPASTQKLLTSAVALTVLGRDFRFTTTLARVGEDLVVVGDGDPALGDPVLAAGRGGTIYDELDAWAAAARAAGITEVRDLVLDDSIFSAGRYPDWPRDQADRWYCAPVGGLNFNDNCIDVQLTVTPAGVQPAITPASRFIAVGGAVRAGRRDLWSSRLSRDASTITLAGEVSRSMTEPYSTSIDEPTLLLGRVLADRLAKAGVNVRGQVVRRQVSGADGALPAGAAVVAQHATPLSVVLGRMNQQSLNMMAECALLRSAARYVRPATFDAAATVGNQVLQRIWELPAEQVTVADGSGMSRSNRVSAFALAGLLHKAATRDAGDAQVLLASLAAPGEDGTFEDRFTDLAGSVVGKTGSLAGVKTLAGYILDPQGRPVIAFAILCNNVQGGNAAAKDMQDAVVREWVRVVRSLAP